MPPPHWYTLVIWGVVHPRSSKLQFKKIIKIFRIIHLYTEIYQCCLDEYADLDAVDISSIQTNIGSMVKNGPALREAIEMAQTRWVGSRDILSYLGPHAHPLNINVHGSKTFYKHITLL